MGAREDWRYAAMRARWGRAWPLASFFLVYLIQQGMLVGLTLPLYAVFSSRTGWRHGPDLLATAGCITGTAPLGCIRRVVYDAHRSEWRRALKCMTMYQCVIIRWSD